MSKQVESALRGFKARGVRVKEIPPEAQGRYPFSFLIWNGAGHPALLSAVNNGKLRLSAVPQDLNFLL